MNPMYSLTLTNNYLWHRRTTDIAPVLAAMRVAQLEDCIARLLPPAPTPEEGS